MKLRFVTLCFLLPGCVSRPSGCEPLMPQRRDTTLFEGKCKKLVYHGVDYSADCRGEMLLFDPADKTRTLYFFTNSPHETIVFLGEPFSVDPNSLRFDVHRSGRAPRSLVGTELNTGPEKGSCNFVARDPKSFLVKCESKTEKGKVSSVEFASGDRHTVWCKDDFPKPEKL